MASNPFNPDPVEDGDDATVAVMTDVFGEAKAWVDDLDHRVACRRGAINHVQTGALWPFGGDDLTVKNDDEEQVYYFATFGASMTYAA
jgi:hypothetical protein